MAKRRRAVRKAPKAKVRLAPRKRSPAARTAKQKGSSASVRRELAEARAQQAATAEILAVINASCGSPARVFDVILRKAHELCGAPCGSLQLYQGGRVVPVAIRGMTRAFEAYLSGGYPISEALRDGLTGTQPVQFLDLANITGRLSREPSFRAAIDLGKIRTLLTVPLAKDGSVFGRIVAARKEVREFSRHEIALLQSFAAQAAIAIENARLFDEVQAKTSDLEESLQQQTATADVLKVISRSALDADHDLEFVLETLLESAVRLCGATRGHVYRYDGEFLRFAAAFGAWPGFRAFLEEHPLRPGRGSIAGRAALDRTVCHVVDVLLDTDYEQRELLKHQSFRSALCVPMLREGVLIGVMAILKTKVDPFTDRQIELVSTFADQAVIAIENVRLFGEVQAKTRDLEESLQQQTATADVLKVISRSVFDLDAVLKTLLESARQLCGARNANLYLRDGEVLRVRATTNPAPEAIEFFRDHPITPSRRNVLGRVLLSGDVEHVADVTLDPEFDFGDAPQIANFRAVLGVPLLRDGRVEGALALARGEPGYFDARQVELVRAFADQAQIAIQNVRLFNETKEALERETATADILKVIASSPSDLQPVFQAIADRSNKLVGGYSTGVVRFIDDTLELAAFTPVNREADAALRASFPRPRSEYPIYELVRGGEVIEISDSESELGARARMTEFGRLRGFRSLLLVPLIGDKGAIGLISVTRKETGHFEKQHIALLRTFADQAVIAIQNVALFEEVQARTRELSVSLQQQTATADVLKVISQSTFDLGSVLQTLVESAAHLCEADKAIITRQAGDIFYRAESFGFSQDFMDHFRTIPIKPDRGSGSGRALLERKAIQILDIQADPEYTLVNEAKWGEFRTALAVPILRENTAIGVLSLLRSEVRPFTDKQIELVSTFADQAAIAIENARLVAELRERQAELRVTFDNMADGVVMFDAASRLAAWNRNFQEILDLPDDFLARRPSFEEFFRYLADRGEYSADLEAELSRANEDPRQELRFERTRPDGRVVEVRRNAVAGGGFVMIYSDITERKRAEAAISKARDAAETALRELQAAQDRLVQTEKLASLGQLTAGIAHEIKNPLNFVNNFSALSAELVDEMSELLENPALDDSEKRKELDQIRELLKSNLEKVVQHGKRADSIVKNMLLHSRSGAGEQRSADLNALVEESLNLAYHGARAEKHGFNITLERDFDPSVGEAEIYPQEIMRVFLNLISNGFYAATKRAAQTGNGFEPVVRAATKDLGDAIEIRIRDNGTGIPPDVKDKIFNPFFTTKPAGEGTGLGLSMSHDIVVKQHGGRIDVATEPGSFTEFIITLPRRAPVPAAAGGQRIERQIEHVHSRCRRRAGRRKPVSPAIPARHPLRPFHYGVRQFGAAGAGVRANDRGSLADPDPVGHQHAGDERARHAAEGEGRASERAGHYDHGVR